MSLLVTGRRPFPLAALRHCVPADGGDFRVIMRSLMLGDAFHGLVELAQVSAVGMAMIRRGGWKVYVPPQPQS
jgi:hypothetical protein